QLRERTLHAVLAWAHPATRSDRNRVPWALHIQPQRIHHAFGMLQIAAQRHREGLAGLAMAHRATADLPRQPEMAAAIGHARGLGKDAAWLVERLVDDP